jgi:hypothetical protein
MPGSSLKGSYLPHQYIPTSLVSPQAYADMLNKAENTYESVCAQISSAYTVLERDFSTLDKNQDSFIEYVDLSEAYSHMVNEDKYESVSRLHRAFLQVDLDRSNTLDFREYLLFAFTLVQEGAYRDVVCQASDAATVKKFLMKILALYK